MYVCANLIHLHTSGLNNLHGPVQNDVLRLNIISI